MRELAPLLEDAPASSAVAFRRRLERELARLGRARADLLAFDENPLGVASVAQVHRATLRRRPGDAPHAARANGASPRDGGTVVDEDAPPAAAPGGAAAPPDDEAPLDVVVKMQHAGVAPLFACDLASAQQVSSARRARARACARRALSPRALAARARLSRMREAGRAPPFLPLSSFSPLAPSSLDTPDRSRRSCTGSSRASTCARSSPSSPRA